MSINVYGVNVQNQPAADVSTEYQVEITLTRLMGPHKIVSETWTGDNTPTKRAEVTKKRLNAFVTEMVERAMKQIGPLRVLAVRVYAKKLILA